MMKAYSCFVATAALLLAGDIIPAFSADTQPVITYETPQEFFASADLDGDGRPDTVIVDKATGKYRLGYQTTAGVLSWVDNRPSGIKGLTGFSVGHLISKDHLALAFTSPDANQITMVEAFVPTSSGRPVQVPFSAALGPNTVVAVDIG